MPDSQTSQNMSALDKRINEQLDYIRGDIMQLLVPNRSPPLSGGDLSIAIQTIKSTADTTWILAEKQRLWAETEKIKANTEQLRAETEKIRAHKN